MKIAAITILIKTLSIGAKNNHEKIMRKQRFLKSVFSIINEKAIQRIAFFFNFFTINTCLMDKWES